MELGLELCVDFEVFEDGIVEEEEMVQLHVTSDDPAILLVEANTITITIINTDGNYLLLQNSFKN